MGGKEGREGDEVGRSSTENIIREPNSNSVDDDGRSLYHVLERLQVATGLASGSMRWAQDDTSEMIERMLCGAITKAAEVLEGSTETQKGDGDD